MIATLPWLPQASRSGHSVSDFWIALREAKAGLDTEEIAGAVIRAEGIGAEDPDTLATIRQRCTMAMCRCYDRRQEVKERRLALQRI